MLFRERRNNLGAFNPLKNLRLFFCCIIHLCYI
nr:MAG TPA: hypothetical protein [Caudoviricetes sp.]